MLLALYAQGDLPLCVQALHCVEVMSLLMRQYLRDKVEASLLHYQDFWQAYAVPQGSRIAYAGVLLATSLMQTQGASQTCTCNFLCACHACMHAFQLRCKSGVAANSCGSHTCFGTLPGHRTHPMSPCGQHVC
jgi:hypothetical protein